MPTLKLNVSQVSILHTLMRNPNGLTREVLAERSGSSCDYNTLGPVYYEEGKYPESLVALGLVAGEKYSPTDPTVFVLTARGKEIAPMYKRRKIIGKNDKIPDEMLIDALKAIRVLRTYGLESFTEDDIKELRSGLPIDYHHINVPAIRQQIVNLRKRGAFKENNIEPQWYQTYRNSKEGKLFASVILRFYGGCTINSKDEGNITVYHRTFWDEDGLCLLGRERAKDGIALCKRCYNRQARFLCQVPPEDPSETSDPEFGENELDTQE